MALPIQLFINTFHFPFSYSLINFLIIFLSYVFHRVYPAQFLFGPFLQLDSIRFGAAKFKYVLLFFIFHFLIFSSISYYYFFMFVIEVNSDHLFVGPFLQLDSIRFGAAKFTYVILFLFFHFLLSFLIFWIFSFLMFFIKVYSDHLFSGRFFTIELHWIWRC